MARPAIITTKTIHVGVTALARETGLSQPYVSKLLKQGYPPNEIRLLAVRAERTRAIRAREMAARDNAQR